VRHMQAGRADKQPPTHATGDCVKDLDNPSPLASQPESPTEVSRGADGFDAMA
jgi:hypothetical protein